MNRIPNNQRRLEEAVKRAAQQGAKGRNEPDELTYIVIHKGQAIPIGQRTNELTAEGKTVSTIKAVSTDSGTTFTHVKDFVVTDCGCRLNTNSQVDKLYRCHYCGGLFCSKHITLWEKGGIAFCSNTGCLIQAKAHQLGNFTANLLAFSFAQVFGFERESCTKSVPLPIEPIEKRDGEQAAQGGASRQAE